MKYLITLMVLVLSACSGERVVVVNNSDRVSELERRADLNDTLDTLQSALIALNGEQIASLDERVTALENLQAAIQAAMAALEEAMNAGDASLQAQIDALAEQLASVQNDLSNLNEQVAELAAQIEDIEEAIAALETAPIVSTETYASSSCTEIAGSSPQRFVKASTSSNKASIYSNNSCSNQNKVADLSEAAPVLWLSPSQLATFATPSYVRVVNFQ